MGRVLGATTAQYQTVCWCLVPDLTRLSPGSYGAIGVLICFSFTICSRALIVITNKRFGKTGGRRGWFCEWVTAVMSLLNRRISVLSITMSRRLKSVFYYPDVFCWITELHFKFVFDPADKASNNIVFVCQAYYINCLTEEFGMSTNTGNPT